MSGSVEDPKVIDPITEFASGRKPFIEGHEDTLRLLQKIRQTQCDMVVPHSQLRVTHSAITDVLSCDVVTPDGMLARDKDGKPLSFPWNRSSMQQLVARARNRKRRGSDNDGGMPWKYVEDLLRIGDPYPGAPIGGGQLAADNLNWWLDRSRTKKSMVRAWAGGVRGFVSNRFRCVDGFDVVTRALQSFESLNGTDGGPVQIRKMFADEKRIYLQAMRPGVKVVATTNREDGRTPRGYHGTKDTLTWSPMVTIKNSDTGHGAVSVTPSLWCEWCSNGAIWTETFSQIHVGGEVESTLFLDPETQRQEIKVTLMKVGDWTRKCFEPEIFEQMAEQLGILTAAEIPGDKIEEAKTIVVDACGLDEGESITLMSKYITGTEMWGSTEYTMFQALTNLAQDVGDPRRQLEMEGVGGRIMARDLVLVKT